MAAPRGASGRPPANAALRGGLLIVVAVLIGLALMSWGFADEGGLVAGPDETTEPTDTAEPTDTTDGTAPPATLDGETTEPGEVLPPPRDPSEVTALVLNGSGVGGAAARVNNQLLSLNYTPRAPDNTPERVAETAIYYLETWRAEALQIAADLNVTTDIVIPMPVPAPHGAELGEATILIILGEDGLIASAAG